MSVPNSFCNECGAQVETVKAEITNSQTGVGSLAVTQGVCVVCGKRTLFGG